MSNMFIAKEIAIWKYISPQQKSPLKLAYFTHRELLYSRTNPILTWFWLKSETNLWQNMAKCYFNHVTAPLRQPRLLASPLQVTRFWHPGAGQEQDIYTREKRGGTHWSRLGCVAVCLETAEVAEFAIGFLFHVSCACLWSQHWLRRKISTINGSLKIVQVVFLSSIGVLKRSSHGIQITARRKSMSQLKAINWYNKRYRLI